MHEKYNIIIILLGGIGQSRVIEHLTKHWRCKDEEVPDLGSHVRIKN